MGIKRNALSLTGTSRFLTAVGGWDSVSLPSAEHYSLSRSEWRFLPDMNMARQWAASCVINADTVVVFCGAIANNQHTNSIERLCLTASQWEALPQRPALAKSCQVSALCVAEKIVLFGGGADIGYITYTLSHEGEIIEEFADEGRNPGYMCQDGAVVFKGMLFATGRRKDENWARRLRCFDGESWQIV